MHNHYIITESFNTIQDAIQGSKNSLIFMETQSKVNTQIFRV